MKIKKDRDSNKRISKAIVNMMLKKDVKLVALDFDKTIISVHTAGLWTDGPEKLSDFVRPCFKHLIEAILGSTIHLCVVTYSMQPILILETLRIALPKCDVDRIMIRANTPEWLRAHGFAAYLGKQQHLASIITEMSNLRGVVLKPPNVLLLDDDLDNVAMAREFGHKAFEIRDQITLEILMQYAITFL